MSGIKRNVEVVKTVKVTEQVEINQDLVNKETLEDFVIRVFAGNVSQAAKALGYTRQYLGKIIKGGDYFVVDMIIMKQVKKI